MKATKTVCCVKGNFDNQIRSSRPKSVDSEDRLQAIEANLVSSTLRCQPCLILSKSSVVCHFDKSIWRCWIMQTFWLILILYNRGSVKVTIMGYRYLAFLFYQKADLELVTSWYFIICNYSQFLAMEFVRVKKKKKKKKKIIIIYIELVRKSFNNPIQIRNYTNEYMLVPTHEGGVFSITVIVVRNGCSDQSSNTGLGSLHFTSC